MLRHHQTRFHRSVPADPRHVIVQTPDKFASAMAFLRQQRLVALDTETSGLQWFRDARICGVSAAGWDQHGQPQCFYFPVRHQFQPNAQQLPPDMVFRGMREIAENPAITKVLHNLKFDRHMFRRDGVEFSGPIRDTQMEGHLDDENQPKGLKDLAESALHDPRAREFEDRVDALLVAFCKRARMNKSDYRDRYGYASLPVEEVGLYAAWDVDFTLRLAAHFDQKGITTLYRDLYGMEMELSEVLFEMEETGMPIDIPYLDHLAEELEGVKDQLRPQLLQMAGREFNPSSNPEVLDVLLNTFHLDLHKRTKGGDLAVDAEVLEEFDHIPFCKVLSEYREADKISSTYTDSITSRVGHDGCLHGIFKADGTTTGRLSSAEPNLQNFASDSDARALAATGKKVEDGGMDPWSVKRAFLTRGGTSIRGGFDFSQIELRVLAKYSMDPVLLEVYRLGQDVHRRTSLEVFGQEDKETRRRAKVVNFGLCASGHQLVLTHVGLVRLDEIKPWHMVWDGVEWVSHDGLICRGEQEVVSYDGFEATPDHVVYTEDGRKIRLGCLASGMAHGRLAVGGNGGYAVGYYADLDREIGEEGDSHRCGCCVWCLQEGKGSDLSRGEEGAGVLPVSEGQVQRPPRAHARTEVRRYGAALSAGYARLIKKLQGAWHQGAVSLTGGLHSLGIGEMAEHGFQGTGFGPEGQCRALFQGQPSFGFPFHQFEEPALPQAQDGVSAGALTYSGKLLRESENGLPFVQALRAHASKTLPRQKTRRTLVYDLLNAGPRHRFTVSGKIVSNSYCLSESGFARQAKIPIEVAAKNMRTFFERYARIEPFRAEFWAHCRQFNPPQFRDMWGRPRRIPDMNSLDEYRRGRAERQAVGSLIQGTAAGLTKVALVRLWRWEKQNRSGMKFVSNIHDALYFDFDKSQAKDLLRVIIPAMEYHPQFDPVPIVTDAEYFDTNMAESKKFPKEWVQHLYTPPAT